MAMHRDQLVELLSATPGGLRVSIFLPAHRRLPAKRQDPVRFRNLVARAEAALRARHSESDHERLLAPLREREADARTSGVTPPRAWRCSSEAAGGRRQAAGAGCRG